MFVGLGFEFVKMWLEQDIVGCLQKFFVDCQKGDFLKDPEVLFFEVHFCSCNGGGC